MLPEQLALTSGGRRTVYVLRHDLSTDTRPVYELDGSGTLTFPSGRVWVRFADDATAHANDLERLGFHIDHIPGYAPNAAYVRASDIATALHALDELRALSGVEHVEPELQMERSFRG